VHAEPTAIERGRHLLVLLPVKDWPAKPVVDKMPNPPPKNKSASQPTKPVKPEGGTP
jgi:rod shape-determining protein MreC